MKKMILFCTCCMLSFATVSAQEPENWARFRGPNGQGISNATGLPLTWSSTENIAWKTDIPGEGWSSPIVWNDHIFLTTATEEGKNCHVIALDRKTGKIRWNKLVFTQPANQHRHEMNSYATPTPVTDGKSVYAVFAGGSFVSLDFDGNIQWINSDLQFYSHHGMGTSPILYGDLLLLAVDQSNRGEPRGLGWQTPWDKGYLLALDKNTGKERWKGMRGMSRLGHSTPVILKVNGKDQIISPAGNVLQGFDPADGKVIWTVSNFGEPCVPSVAIGDGLVYTTTTPTEPIRAVRPDGQGDCTATHLAWEQKGSSPMMGSFLYVKPSLYSSADGGYFASLNANTGEVNWRLLLRIGALNPSPIYADGKIYVLSEQGTTAVLKPSADPKQEPEIIAKNELGERSRASIAVAGKQLVIRTAGQLWCIGK
ncbi:MAG: PQQ-like beta-propeller repeat protein [Tannerella sp.]|nr:PQQ-like beta-propeller repeat protein [Tannerella sp.]